MTGVRLKFELDDTTAVAYINIMGSSKSQLCDAVARKIWAWCIWVRAVYISGRTNVVADRLSREHHSEHEWMLNRQIFSKLCVLYPGLSIYLFATTLNAQLPRFASWRLDPRAEAQRVLLVPARPTQTWYNLLLQMLSGQPVVMVRTAHSDLLIHPSGPKMYNLQGRLGLMACPVRQFYREQGFSEHVTDVLLGSLRPATQKQYTVYFKNGLRSVVQGRMLRVHRI